MRSVELTAKSLDEAKQLAAERLGVAPDSVQVSVLEETKGLFGKMNLRVRAEAAEAAEAAVMAPPKPAPARPAAPAKQSPPMQAVQESFEAPPPAEVSEEAAAEHGPEEAEVVANDEHARLFQELVDDVLASGQLDVTAKASPSGGRYVNIVLDGKDVAFLVGKHGEVLNALQYLINIMAARRFHNGVRATLDGNDYRRRREEALSNLAQTIAAEVKARREEAVLDALPAFERRVVHKALASLEGVTTYSEGEEPNRRVVIAPAE